MKTHKKGWYADMQRRYFLYASAGLIAALLLSPKDMVFADHGEIEKMTLSKDEWEKRLTPEQFRVLRKEGTEPSGTSPLNNEKRKGTYVCAGCGFELFSSDMKYDSGTGWPSFSTRLKAMSKPALISNCFIRARNITAPVAAAIRACLQGRSQTDGATVLQ